jgi:hypothetical protein
VPETQARRGHIGEQPERNQSRGLVGGPLEQCVGQIHESWWHRSYKLPWRAEHDTPKIYRMLRRVLKSKRADRLLWVALFILTLVGVGVALWLSGGKRQRWIGGQPPESELVPNPLAATNQRADSLPAPPKAAPVDSAPVAPPKPAPRPKAVPPKVARPKPTPRKTDTTTTQPGPDVGAGDVQQLLTTPTQPTLAVMTSACRNAIDSRGPWRDSSTTQPWPECVANGNPMLVQFCTYAQLASEGWVLAENSKDVPRCRAELPQVQAGKLRALKSR